MATNYVLFVVPDYLFHGQTDPCGLEIGMEYTNRTGKTVNVIPASGSDGLEGCLALVLYEMDTHPLTSPAKERGIPVFHHDDPNLMEALKQLAKK